MNRNSSFSTLDLLILSILTREDNHGYGISFIISEESEGDIIIKEGVLYPILCKLKDESKISSYHKIVNRRSRVYYHLEEAGVKELEIQTRNFMSSYKTINRILEGGEK